MEISMIVNIVLSILSFILAAISVITVVINLIQNRKLLEANARQLEEMREEHRLSSQPVLELEAGKFFLERPRLFYTPPEDSYDYISRYHYETTLKNVSQATAICIDICAELIVPIENQELRLSAASVRQNVLPYGERTSDIDIRFSQDNKAYLYEALRVTYAKELPRLKVKVVYKNTCGGYFLQENLYVLVPHDEDGVSIRNWHTNIISAPIEGKDALSALKRIPKGKDWEELFELSKRTFDLHLTDPEKARISIELREIPEKYNFRALEKTEYEKEISEHGYSKFVYKRPECMSSGSDSL